MPAPAFEYAPGALERDVDKVARLWGGSWGRLLFPGFWLVYLGTTINWIANHQHGWHLVVGEVLVAAFAVVYLSALPLAWGGRPRAFWPWFALAIAITVAEAFIAHKSVLVFCVYLAVMLIASRWRHAGAAVLALVLACALLPKVIPSWGGAVDWNDALTVTLVSIAMVGMFKIIQSNIELAAARAEVARLAAENERSRIARDLHDLLGHSLTTITVKAGLARRLAERGENDRARVEIGEVESLSRRTLGDVRAAVASQHEVTLAAELATAREVLRAAGILAQLPGSVDLAEPALSELFGWVLREGITNVVRHSRANHCTVTLGARSLEIADDGLGGGVRRLDGARSDGSGLAGLAQRVAAYGGTVESGGSMVGWRLRVEVPEVPEHVASAATMPA
jgi:two-component system sensor histidine kinase DesK